MQTYLDQLYKDSERDRYGEPIELRSADSIPEKKSVVDLLKEEMDAASNGDHKALQLQYIALVSVSSLLLYDNDPRKLTVI